MNRSDDSETDDEDDRRTHGLPDPVGRKEPGGPYFGRLLIVLLLAVAFCGFMTWFLGARLPD